ncbi:BrnT family toxin [Candidatus Binatus sp.]|uniref:BrnT family toxin n=1 Tax=Candidatus Binatus sp. TaxID=2811406 RepID=UPI00351CC277
MHVEGFDWDEGNRIKCEEHGVSTVTIESLFAGEIAVLPDPLHSKFEERFKAIGKTDKGREIFVVFTLRRRRGRTLIRPISARYMRSKEMEHYEKETATLAER